MKKILGLFAVVLVVFLGVLVFRGIRLGGSLEPIERVEIEVDEERIAGHLAEAIRFRTISPGPPAVRDPAPFEAFISWAASAYPEVHSSLELDRIGGLSLLFTWPGRNPDAAPILLTAHYDVVPVNPGSESDWSHPPFAGVVEDGVVWGRGALDDKGAVIALLEAVTALLEEGFEPERTIYIAFGHDEEIGGAEGAGAIVDHLLMRGVRPEWSLDEGSYILEGILPGLAAPVASINVAEKGYLTIELVARGQGGHSSMPPGETAVGTLARAITRLQDNPMPGGLDGLTGEFFEALAAEMPLLARIAVANRWLFGGLIEQQLGGLGSANAMLRTTTAPTMLVGSIKENVLPTEAIGTVNFRLHPRDRVEDVLEHVRTVVDDDRVEIRVSRAGNEASAVSSTESQGFRDIAQSAQEVHGPMIVAPGLTVGGTDSRHWSRVAIDAYRFNPMRVGSEDIAGFHGTDERMTVENLAQGTRSYIRLIELAAGDPGRP
jgi:carboxypeptidase PM20D1